MKRAKANSATKKKVSSYASPKGKDVRFDIANVLLGCFMLFAVVAYFYGVGRKEILLLCIFFFGGAMNICNSLKMKARNEKVKFYIYLIAGISIYLLAFVSIPEIWGNL